MDANQNDEETFEFEIEVVSSSSNVSLASGIRDAFESLIDVANQRTPDQVGEERRAQETDCSPHQQADEPRTLPADPTEIHNHKCTAQEEPGECPDVSHGETETKNADVARPKDSLSEQQSAEPDVKGESLEAELHVESVYEENIPTEANVEPLNSPDNQEQCDLLEAPNETTEVDESSEPTNTNVATVCNKVVCNDLNPEAPESLQEEAAPFDSTGGTFNLIGEQSAEQQSETQYQSEPPVEAFGGLIVNEAALELATLQPAEAVREVPNEEEATKHLCESVILQTAPSECQLVSENNRCPDGWVFVENPVALRILSLVEAQNLATADAQPLEPLDAADKDVNLQFEDAEGAHQTDIDVERSKLDVAESALPMAVNSIDRQENLSVDQAGPPADIVSSVTGGGPEEKLVKHHIVDISIELARSACDAAKAPHVIILNDSGDGFNNLHSASHSPISMDERQVGTHDDEYESLGDRDVDEGNVDADEEEDLEREFDEEPEFEARQVVVKRNKDPRDEYELGSELGRGKFGTVVRCRELASGRQLAAKFIAMRRREDREDVEREVAIMSKLQHRRLLQLYDAFDDGRQEMCLITELVEGGELFERIVDDDFELTEKKAAIFMRQICEGVEYMHSQQIVHLDMKPENILCLSRTGNRIKLIDFGLARQLDPKDPIRVMFGTPDFAAPEVLGYEMVTLNTDMWSVGVICYVLLSGLLPFMGENDIDTMANVTRATYDFNDQAFEPISDLAKDFIRKLLLRNPTDRLKPSECLKHPWLQKGGAQLEAAIRERRSSTISLLKQQAQQQQLQPVEDMTAPSAAILQRRRPSFGGESTTSSGLTSLDKRRLKRYVVKRKWHKTVHAIMALNRMGANLNKLTK